MNFAFCFTPCVDRAEAAFEIMLAPLLPACDRSRAQMHCCLTRHDILGRLPQFFRVAANSAETSVAFPRSRYRQSYRTP
jgi:hypothetical protein